MHRGFYFLLAFPGAAAVQLLQTAGMRSEEWMVGAEATLPALMAYKLWALRPAACQP